MEKAYILAVDQSTSGTKAILVDHAGQIAARTSRSHQQIYPQAGWVEHDPLEIYEQVKSVIRQILQETGIQPSQLAALTLTNQRETALIWDQLTGKPIYPAIVWQCQRTADACQALKRRGYEQLVRDKTGLMLDPYFSATKLRWILDHVSESAAWLEQGRLLAGTIDSWLIWKLTGGRVHATDYTNASRTSLFNIHRLQWDDELLTWFGIPRQILPKVQFSDQLFGYTEDKELFDERIPITGVIGDSQGALFGQRCFAPGMAKATYGTGTSVLMNIGNQPLASRQGLVSAIAWGRNQQVTYAVEGVIRTTGDGLKWLRDHLGMFSAYEELEQLISSVEDSDGVYVVPAFGGLGAPYWDANARAAILGMNRSTQKAHILRAALDSIAYQIKDVFTMIQQESALPLQELRADGGASANALLMQFQADLLDCKVIASEVSELSAMGSVYLGGLAVGYWSEQEMTALHQPGDRHYQPSMSSALREKYYGGWKQAVSSILSK